MNEAEPREHRALMSEEVGPACGKGVETAVIGLAWPRVVCVSRRAAVVVWKEV